MTFEQRVFRILEKSDNEYSVADVLCRLQDKTLFAFEVKGILILVEVLSYPQKRILSIFGMEGEGALAEMEIIVPFCSDLGRSLDCTELRCYGRKGWEKVLKEYGAKSLYTVLSLEL